VAGFDVRGELLIGGEWIDATGELLKRQALTHQRGRQDQGARVDPATLQPLLNNTNGQFSPDNPMGPYYGQFGRNTPFRLSVKAGTPALELPGSGSSNASTPDAAVLDITTNLDIRWEGEADWYAPDAQILIGKWGAPGQRSYHLRLQDGLAAVHVTTDGTGGAFAGRPLPVLPRHAALRGTVEVGASWTIRLYWAESMDGPWTQLGETAVVAGAAPIFATTTPLTIAPEHLDASPPRRAVAGRCYRAEVRDGIDGTVVASPDFTAQPDGTTSFADSAGRTWTVTGDAAITNRRTRLIHELAAYPVRWHPSGKHAWVEATTSGVLRRLQRGGSALQSTLRRRIPSGQPLAYWPMEDGTTATRAASALDGGPPLVVGGMEFASESSLPSSEALPVLGDSASLSGVVPGAASGGWHVEMVYKLDALPATEQTMLELRLSPGAGGVARVRARVSTAAIKVEALDSEGAVVAFFTNTGDGRGDFIGVWNRLQIFSYYNGSQTYVSLAWRDVVTGLWWAAFAPYTGTPGRLTTVRGSWGSDFRGMAVGHLSAFDVGGTSASQPGVTIYEGSDEAYAGETAGERMQRLADEETYPVGVYGPVDEQERVGPQTPSPILSLLEEAADADGGILYEDRERLRLVYRGRTTMYNQTPALVLDYTQKGLAPPLEPTGDDDGTENDVTVTRTNGSSARAVLEEGALSVLAPPDGVGPYPSQVTLNLAEDSQTEPQAYWRLHHGTFEGRRYPQVRVMVHAAPPELLDQILAVDVGDRLVIRNPPLWVAPGDVELIVQGYQETMASPFEWDIVFNCTPGEPWLLGIVGDPLYGRVDTDGSELAAAVDADDMVLPVLATAGPTWITANQVLNSNPSFEADLAGWGGFGAAIERVAAPVPAPTERAWSLRLTPDGVAEFPNAGSDQIAVTVGVEYTVSGWLRCATARSVALNVNWFGAGSAYLSTSANDQPVEADTWTWFETTVTAPVGAVTANLAPTVADFPPTADVLWAQYVTLREAGGSPVDFPFSVTVGGEVATVDAVTDSASDTFTRTLASTWGTADAGGAWAESGGLASDRSVNGTAGVITLAANPSTIRHERLVGDLGDCEVLVRMSASQVATGASMIPGVLLRYTGVSDYYRARIHFGTSGTMFTSIARDAATVGGTPALPYTYAAGDWFWLRARVIGHRVQLRVWPDGQREPAGVWHSDETITTGTIAAGQVGVTGSAFATNSNVSPQLRYDDFAIVNPQTFTAVRSRNGVSKPHSAGSAVRLAAPTVVAL